MGNSKDMSKTLEGLSPYEFFPYASYIKGRTGARGYAFGDDFKRHKTLAHAKSAVNQWLGRREWKLYRWHEESGKWLEIFL